MRRLAIPTALAVAVLLFTSAGATAGQSPAVADCSAHGRLTRTYSVQQLREALATMPADLQEYTNCYTVIQDSLLAQVGGTHHRATTSKDSSGGSFLSAPLIAAIVVLALGVGGATVVALRRRS